MNRSNVKILIIDDEKLIRETMTGYLVENGFTVIDTDNGEDGIKLFREVRPDLVFVDLMMPIISGFDVLKIINKEFSEVPVVVISGKGEVNDVVEAHRLGAWDYITKPFVDLELIIHVLGKCLEKADLIRFNNEYKHYLYFLSRASYFKQYL